MKGVYFLHSEHFKKRKKSIIMWLMSIDSCKILSSFWILEMFYFEFLYFNLAHSGYVMSC